MVGFNRLGSIPFFPFGVWSRATFLYIEQLQVIGGKWMCVCIKAKTELFVELYVFYNFY